MITLYFALYTLSCPKENVKIASAKEHVIWFVPARWQGGGVMRSTLNSFNRTLSLTALGKKGRIYFFRNQTSLLVGSCVGRRAASGRKQYIFNDCFWLWVQPVKPSFNIEKSPASFQLMRGFFDICGI
ncbi:hypothetical protein [Pseudomonas mercuritolerans]|uniref:Uncharacterized protein n=1 Tax=Pseudomonas mercuritolerans TaxID=2951809 RepID=A0ABT2XPG3_9PSED|nr:hypothetical protein [Pseudomonas mercuritolerans]MCV2220594.1 hypothetical protein [Pseudomonas mercuritolerans]